MSNTKRSVSEGAEEILGIEFPVLDKGFVRLVDYMGNDSSIVQAARVSYGLGTKTPSADEALIRYLMSCDHTSPFEMCEIKLHVKLPTFIARQWIRHRTASVNEYSARYSVVQDEFYTPERSGILPQSAYNKQCRSHIPIDDEEADRIREAIQEKSKDMYALYIDLLGSEDSKNVGIARELARIVLTNNFYTQWYWKIDLHNLMHFLVLRCRDNAQFEISEYAKCIYEKILAPWLPITTEAFADYRLNAKKMSSLDLGVIKKACDADAMMKDQKMSDREFKDLRSLFGIDDDVDVYEMSYIDSKRKIG